MKHLAMLVTCGCMYIGYTAPAQAQSHFNTCVSGTGENATVLINESINPTIESQALGTGDEIAVYTAEGLCVGVETWAGSNVALTIWGDNSLTTEKDGLSANEQIKFVVWDASSQTEYGTSFGSVEVSYVSDAPYNGTGLYDQDAIYQLASMTAMALENPVASFTANPTSGQAPLPVSFDASASSDPDGSISSYSWAFGDGNSGNGVTVNHTYTSAGSYTATLTVTDDDGLSDSSTMTVTVSEAPANEAPSASFSMTPTSGVLPLLVSVDASASSDSDGSITSYAWDFGDGSSASGSTSSHTYSAAGTYQVVLTVTDNDGATDTATRTVTVQSPSNNPPVASLTVTPTSGTAPLTVSVNGSNSSDPDGTIETYAWNFGNGSTASGASSSTVYASGGTYTITLTVTDNDGATGTATATVTVGAAPVNQAPEASFSASPSSGVAPHTTSFDASASTDSDGSVVNYSWNFGDGSTGSGVTATHTYNNAGTYTAVLTVTDDDGATDTAQRTITVTSPQVNTPPVASFSATPSSGVAPLNVQFDAATSTDSDGTIASYAWDFGDGTSATGSTTSHTFTTGSYTVTLTVVDDDGASDETSQVVTATNPPATGGLAAHLTFDESTGTTAGDNSGNSNVGSLQNGATFAVEGIIGGAVRLDGTQAYVDIADDELINQSTVTKRTVALWFNADDVSIANQKQVLFEEGGQQKGLSIYLYDGELYVAGWNTQTEESGWSGTYLMSSDISSGTWHHVALVLNGGPQVTSNAFFGYLDGQEFSRGDGSQLWPHQDDIAVGGIDGNTWFHDRTNKSGQAHGFSGLIDDLRIYNENLNASEIQSLASAGAGVNQVPVARIETDVNSGPAPLTVGFDGRSSSDIDGQIQSYQWTFEDGTTATGGTANRTFDTPGTYTITLRVTDDGGGTDTATKTIVVNSASAGAPPIASITENPIRSTTMTVSLDGSNSNDPDGAVTAYAWDFGDGETATGEAAEHEYSTPGSYEVALTVTDDNNLASTARHWTSVYRDLPQNTGTSLVGSSGDFDPGYADYADEILTVRAPAVRTTPGQDIFRFVYEAISGDGTITVRVEDIDRDNSAAAVGIAIRSHLTPAATMSSVVITGDGRVIFENRTLSGLDKVVFAEETTAVPVFVRLTRQGHVLRAFSSEDGSIWTALGSAEIGMPETVFMGVTAHSGDGVAFNATLDYVLLESASAELPEGYRLSEAYPNPFNPSTQVTLVVTEDQEVSVEVYNVVGQRVKTLFSGAVAANQLQEYRFASADDLSSGLYFIRVVGEAFVATRKVTLLK